MQPDVQMPVLTQACGRPVRVSIALRLGMTWVPGRFMPSIASTTSRSAGRSGLGGMKRPSGRSAMPSSVPQTVISCSVAA